MSPLLNPRHEAFAFALAFGSTPAEAYLEAGFNPKNRKARAQPLADDPIIVNRVNELLAEEGVGDPAFARHRNAHPFTIIPQSADELAQYVWQIIKGSRQVTAIQWQATRFLGRLKRWDRSGRHEPGPDSGLSTGNRESLAILDAVQIARDTQLHSAGLVKNVNGDEEYDGGEFESPALFDPDAPIYPHDPVVLTREERDALAAAEIAAELAAAALAAAALLNPPDPSDLEAAAVSPPKIHICGSNVDSNPHAQLPDNQPINPKNPQMWIKKEKSTSAACRTKTSSQTSLRPLPLCPSAVEKPNTPDSPPAPVSGPVPVPTITSKAFPPLPECWQPEDLFPEDVEWLATVMGSEAPDWVRSQYPAAAGSGPRPSPLPLPPYDAEDYAPEELKWIIAALGQDATDWLRAPNPDE